MDDNRALLLSDTARQQLMALARYLAKLPGAPRPSHLHEAQQALRLNNSFEWFASVFQSFAGPELAVHWYQPHRLAGTLNDSTVALAIGPSDRSQEDATLFYRINDGFLEDAEQITDDATLFQRLALALSWDLRDKVTPHVSGWRQAMMEALKADLRGRLADQRPYVRLLIEAGIEQPWPTAEALIVAYLALGVNPAEAIAEAIKSINLPMPTLDE